MIKEFKNKKENNGFTLIEVMVSVSIFAIVVLVSMTATLSIINANKQAQALGDVINNMNFSVESMVRDLRTGYNYTCGSPSSSTSGCPATAVNSVTFRSSISGCDVRYWWDSGAKTINKDSFSPCTASTQTLTSNNISVSKFDLFVTNTNASSYQQPLILMILKAKGSVGKQSTEFNLQTLISQRRLNI